MIEQTMVAWEVTDSKNPGLQTTWCFVMATDEAGAIEAAKYIDASGSAFDPDEIEPEEVTVRRSPDYDVGIAESELFRRNRMWAYCHHCDREVKNSEHSESCYDAYCNGLPDDDDCDDVPDDCFPVIGAKGDVYCSVPCWRAAGETERGGTSPVLPNGICLYADV